MEPLTILFLQGPASPFLRKMADLAEIQGAKIHKIQFCIGDALFWFPRRADWFTGGHDDWSAFLRAYVLRHGVTDIVMLGDGRPKHSEASHLAAQMNLRVHVLEHGYLRPDWLMLEPGGRAISGMPRDQEGIRDLARTIPAARLGKRFDGSFLTYALYDLTFHIPNVLLGWLVHPHYRAHGPVHPLMEYAGWISKAFSSRHRRQRARQTEEVYLEREQGTGAGFFLFPLQLPGDYQIRRHAPGGDLYELVTATIRSFALGAPAGARLLFKVHPIDNGLSKWSGRVGMAAADHGVADRVDVIDGGSLEALIAASTGIVTVNSTVGLTALLARKPVIALGNAIYDIEGLTHQGALSDFWNHPAAPAADLPLAFATALTATTHVRGGFIGKEAVETGARHVSQRLFSQNTRPESHTPANDRFFRYEAELLGHRGADGV